MVDSRAFVGLGGLLLATACATAHAAPDPRDAAARALPLLQHTMDAWFEERTCTSCHHHSLAAMALAFAKERGLPVDDERLAQQVDRLGNSPDGTAAALQGRAAINPASGRSYQLVALAAAGHAADERTDAMVHVLAGLCSDGGAWLSQSHRPPLEDSAVTTTAFCCRALLLYGPPGREAELAAKVARGRAWLRHATAADNEERTMRLLGLHWTGADPAVIAAAAEALRGRQNLDGGWAQLDGDPSDAYATGQTLVALQQVGGLAVANDAYRRGVDFLLSTQFSDGSWRVQTRRRARGLEHFESGFPHGEHQFISCAATAWAMMALAAAADPRPSVLFHGGRPARSTTHVGQLGTLHAAAAFGTAADLQRALDAGGDVQARGPEGVTPLMLAVHDARKVELLLQRGAAVEARSEFGNTALLLAAATGPLEVVEQLLAAGADPTARDEEGFTALSLAVVSADEAKVRRLLAAGVSHDTACAEGFAALQMACWQDDAPMVRLLLAAGADGNVRTQGSPPLVLAAIDGLAEVTAALLHGGAVVDATDEDGMTALAWAARIRLGDDRIAAQLLAAGADPDRPDKGGRTPRDWAELERNEAVLRLLR